MNMDDTSYDLGRVKGMIEQAADLTQTARAMSEQDRDYYDHHQYSADEVAVLQARRQPILPNNAIQKKIDALVGIEQQGRTDPRAYARRPGGDAAAEAATAALVFVDDATRFDQKKSYVFENMCIEGYGGCEVVVEEKRGQFWVAINRLRWEEIVFDPHSREKDFSDAAYMGYMKWMSKDAAMTALAPIYDGTADELSTLLDASMRNPQDGETYEDRPFESNSFRWSDKRQKRVRVATLYYLDKGVWHLCIFTAGGFIWTGESPYLDSETQKPANAIELATAYIDRENRRYGPTRAMLSSQDEINMRRSKLLHMLNNRQTIGVKGAVDDVAHMKRELSMGDGHVEVDVEAAMGAAEAGMRPFELIQNQDQVVGQFQLLQESKKDIDQYGPNAALLGSLGSTASGRAIMAQQQAGFAELAPLYDSLRDWQLRVYRAMWSRIKQFWTDERWIRITGQDGSTQFLAFNEQVGMEQYQREDGIIGLRPIVSNPIAEMDVDIVIDDVQDYATLRQEQFEQMASLAEQGYPIPPEMLIETSSIRNKKEIMEAMNAQNERQNAMQGQMAQLETAEKAAGIEKTRSETQENMSQTVKNLADAQTKSAETNVRLLEY